MMFKTAVYNLSQLKSFYHYSLVYFLSILSHMKTIWLSFFSPVALFSIVLLQMLASNQLFSLLFHRPVTCDTNTSAIFDSFGTPCIKFSSLGNTFFRAYRSPELSYLYCSIPKNGCTYHLAMMHRLMDNPYEGAPNVHGSVDNIRLKPGDEIFEMLQQDVRRYVVVRNPLFRVLSAYLNKVEHKYKDESLKTPQTFRNWVYKNLSPGMNWKGVNAHWKAQVEFCGFKVRDVFSYLTMFRVEKPEEYVNYMEEFLPDHVLKDGWDMPHNKSFREHVLGPRIRTENTTQKFYDYVGNLRTFDYLRKVYNEDIVAFGYEDKAEEMRKQLIGQISEKM